MKYKILSILICALFLCSLCGCGQTTSDRYTIAVIAKSTTSDFWQNVLRGVNAAATEYNISITFDGPASEEDYTAQNAMITAAVARGDDAIVLSAIDYDKSADAVNAAVAAGVAVIMIDSDVNSERTSAFIGTDNYEAGYLAGEAASELLADKHAGEKAKIGLVNYAPYSANGQEREAGFRAYIEEYGGEIIDCINAESNTESATAGALSLLEAHPEINVIVGFNEWMTLGIGCAIRVLGLSDDVIAIGFDSNVVSIGMLETGEMDALMVQNPFAIGYLGVRSAAELLSGKDIDPQIITSTTVITKDNMFDEENQRILFKFR